MEVLFREFRRQDIDAFYFLEQRCYPEPYRLRFHQLLRTLLDKDVVALVGELAPETPGGASRLAGGMVLRLEPGEKRVVVVSLMVDETLRRKGLGRRLLHKAIAVARHAGQGELVVPVEQGNPAAGQFLTACGFGLREDAAPFFTSPGEGAVWRMEFETSEGIGT